MPNDVRIRLDQTTYDRVKQDSTAENRSMSNVIRRIVQAHYDIPPTDNRVGQPKKENPIQDLIDYFGIAVAESYLLMNDGQLGFAYASLVRVAEDDPQESNQRSRDLLSRYRKARSAALEAEVPPTDINLTGSP